MATTTTINSSFVGKDAGMYIAAAMKESKSLNELTIMDNVKYKAIVKSLVGADFVQDESCDFTPTGSLTLSEKVITPKALKLNLQLCKQDLLSAWESNQMGAGANNRNTPEFHAFVMSYLADAIAESTENNIWSGADAQGGEFEGFLTATTGAFATDGNVVAVTKVGASIDASNIVDNLSAIADAIPSTVLGKEDLCIFINQKHYRNYIHKMSELGYIDRFNMSADYTPVFEGIKLCVVDGMPNDKLVAARRSNLFFGTDLVGDQSELRMLDMADIDGSDNIRVICKYTAGTQIGIGSEIAYLS